MLQVHRDQVDVEVITPGSRGVLGFGAENARVKLLIKLPLEPKREPEPEPEPEPAVGLAAGPAEPLPAAEQLQPESDEEAAGKIGQEILSELLRRMNVQASVEIVMGYELADEDEPPPVVLNITGEDLGILIGRRGDTLRALQYLVRLMVSHRLKHWTNLVVDVENYVVRRQRTLESLAQRVAEQVARSGRTQALEPMSPYERRVIHMALRKHPDVTTQSVGEGERRKVTIIPK